MLTLLRADCPRRDDFSTPCGAVYLDPLGMTPAEFKLLQDEVAEARRR